MRVHGRGAGRVPVVWVDGWSACVWAHGRVAACRTECGGMREATVCLRSPARAAGLHG